MRVRNFFIKNAEAISVVKLDLLNDLKLKGRVWRYIGTGGRDCFIVATDPVNYLFDHVSEFKGIYNTRGIDCYESGNIEHGPVSNLGLRSYKDRDRVHLRVLFHISRDSRTPGQNFWSL